MKRFLLLLVSFFSIGLVTAQDAEEKAATFLENGNFDGARQMYDSLYSANPEQISYLYFSGICDFEQKMENSAIDKFNKVMSKIPKDQQDSEPAVQVSIHLGKAHHNIYLFDEAIGIYDRLLSYDLKKKKYAEVEELKEQAQNAKELMKDFKQIMVTKLAIINSPYDDHTPIPADKGNIIFFTSKRPHGDNPQLSPEGKYYEDIYVWNRNRGLRSKPYNIGPPVNTSEQDATAGASHDGTLIFIFKATDKNPGDLFISVLDDSVWSEPEALNKNINKKKSREQHAALSPDGNTLYFSSNYRKGEGGNDIWVSQKQDDGTWGKAENLMINTEKDEGAPFIMADGKTLYFSSKGYKGMGGYDVFRTVMNEDGSWKEPENLGFPINTTGDDIFYFPAENENIAYFTRRSAGTANIFKAQMYGEQEEFLIVQGILKDDQYYTQNLPITKVSNDTIYTESGFFTKSMNKMVYTDSVVSISQSEEALTQCVYYVPSENTISVYNVNNEDYQDIYQTNSNEGDYKFLIIPQKQYKVVYESDGFLFDTKNIDATKPIAGNVVEYDAVLNSIESGKTKKVKLTPFNNNSDEINNFTAKELDIIADYFKKYPQLRIDFSGSDSPLLADRQQAVEDYLTDKGVSKDKIFRNLSLDTIPDNYLQYTIFDEVLLADLEDEKNKYLDSLENTTQNSDSTTTEPGIDEIEITIENVYFAFNYSTLSKGEEIDKLANYLTDNPQARVLIVGYTDAVGSESYNKSLSLRRAKFVKSLLTKAGADAKQIDIKGYGESNPVTYNKIDGKYNEESKKYNRRVEFQVLKQGEPKVRIIQMQDVPVQYKKDSYQTNYSGR